MSTFNIKNILNEQIALLKKIKNNYSSSNRLSKDIDMKFFFKYRFGDSHEIFLAFKSIPKIVSSSFFWSPIKLSVIINCIFAHHSGEILF